MNVINPEYILNANGQLYVKGSMKVIVPNSNLIIYVSMAHGEVRSYRGIKTKAESVRQYNIRASDINAVKEAMKSNVDYMISVEKSAYERDVEYKKATALVKKNTKVGDIFCSKWGSGQTNVCFYQVVEIKGATYSLRELKKERIEKGNTMTGVVVPLIGSFEGEQILKKRISDGCFKIESFERAYPLKYSINEITGSRVYDQQRYTAYN